MSLLKPRLQGTAVLCPVVFTIFLLTAFIGMEELSAQVISYISPESGQVGTGMAIYGSGFNADLEKNVVYFGGVRANVNFVDVNKFVVPVVPPGCFYAPISVLNKETGKIVYTKIPYRVTFSNNSTRFTPYTFYDKGDVTTGTGPFNVAAGDFDGDGRPDIVVVNNTANTISLHRSVSSIGVVSFTGKQDMATGNNPSAVRVADIDADGKLDIVVANGGSNSISVYRNTGTAPTIFSFDSKIDFATGASPYSLAIADFDSDGKPDVATVNRGGANTVSVLRNTSTAGAVSFAAKTDLTAGNDPISIGTGFINLDDKPDIVVTNFFGSNLSVFKNLSTPGALSFASKVDVTTASFPIDIAVGDIDLDGKQDLVVASAGDNSISVLQNFSTADNFTISRTDSTILKSTPVAITINDFDGNGYPDIAAVTQLDSTVALIRNDFNGDGLAHISSPAVHYKAGNFSSCIASADFDNDHSPDIVTGNYHTTTASVLLNREISVLFYISPCISSSITLNSSVTGTTYQWQMSTGGADFFDISPSDQGFPGSTTADLTIKTAYSFLSDWGFRCKVDGNPGKIFVLKYSDSWNGRSSNNWSDIANWNCGQVPDANTDVLIKEGNVVVDADAVCKTLTVLPGATITVNEGVKFTVMQ
ncbi:MAG: FG-GAP-like repeat-containing protein [Ferruginibacter sp.]